MGGFSKFAMNTIPFHGRIQDSAGRFVEVFALTIFQEDGDFLVFGVDKGGFPWELGSPEMGAHAIDSIYEH